MLPTLLKLICCPLCQADLQLHPGDRDGDHIIAGRLTCAHCNCSYPIIGGVPRLLPGELPADMEHTARNFGQSWKVWHTVDDERYTWQLLRWLSPLQPEEFKDKLILDCGCGKGRHLRVMASLGARELVGIDLSHAVDVAFANTRQLPNVHVVQADILHLPLKSNFDLAYSVGVLHHTPDPERSFAAMARQVRPGGRVACWVYGRENNSWIIYFVNPVRLLLTRYLPSFVVRSLSWMLAPILFALILLFYLPCRRLGFKPYYSAYMLYLWDLGFAETRHIIYDHLIAPTAFYLRRREVERWFERAGIKDCQLTWVQRMSWAANGIRAAQKPDGQSEPQVEAVAQQPT